MKPTVDRELTGSEMARLVARLLQPYRGWVAIILLATLIETAMSLAAPWPLKIIIDNVLGGHEPPHWLHDVAKWIPGHSVTRIAAVAAITSVIIAALGAVASYVDNYYTENVWQWVANDLRLHVYDHLEHLSLAYYATHQPAALLSTLTDDIDTIQDFAASATLDILVDVLAIAGMLGLMFWLNWDFALVAVAVAPLLLLFIARFKKAVRKATREVRHRQSDIKGE